MARIYNAEKTVSSIRGVVKTVLEHSLTPYKKNKLKMDQVLNLRPDTIKLLEENISRTLTQITEILSYLHPRVMKVKPRTKKWDLIKLKSFFTAKESISKMKRQPTQ